MDTEAQSVVSLKLTKAALEVWDAGHAAREERWQSAFTASAVNRCVRLDKQEALPVQQAFFREAPYSRLVEPNDAWLRFMIAKHS